MKGIKLLTLLIALKMSEDVDIRFYAKDELLKFYGEEVYIFLHDAIMAESDKESQQLQMKAAEFAAVSQDEISDFYEQVRKARKAKKFPISCIMFMYNSGNEFLIKKSKEYVTINYGNYVMKLIHEKYPTYAEKIMDELYQCGCIGLIQAMRNYDDSKGAFTTYSKLFIQHEIAAQINFHKNSTTVHYNKIQQKIADAKQRIEKEGFEVTVRKLAILTDLRDEIIERELKVMERTRFRYLDDPEDMKDEICGYDASPEAIYAKHEREKALAQSINSLDDDIKQVVIRKYDTNATNEEIALALGISIGQVKTYFQRGLRTMRKDKNLCRQYSEYISDAENEMLKYSMPVVMPEQDIDDQINSLIAVLDTIPQENFV